MSQDCDLTIVGGGIVGLSTAMWASLLFPRLRIVVLEKEPQIAVHQTGRNSGVIHSGIYYRPGSEKARLCVTGAAALLDFCKEYKVPFEICGKVVVATSAQEVPALRELHKRGLANGVSGLNLIEPERLREIEPHAAGVAALHVPTTAITNYLAVAKKYAEIGIENGVDLRTRTELRVVRSSSGTFILETNSGSFTSKFLINCAGLHSDRIATMAGSRLDFKIVPFRGEYYEMVQSRRHLVKNLIYPVADPRFPFLGVHFTRHIDGAVEAGPNAVLALKREGYRWTQFRLKDVLDVASFSGAWKMAARYWQSGAQEMYRSLSKSAFVRSLQQLIPEVRNEDFAGGGAGVRAQAVSSNGSLLDDFCFIRRERALHVCNVPSPAATASLMIGKRVVRMASEEFGLTLEFLPGQADTLFSKWWSLANFVAK